MNKPVTILYTLTQGINEIFNNYLTEEKPSDEQLWLAVSELLSKKHYQERLLFKNYKKDKVTEHLGIKITEEAVFYLTEVLSRRLSLANNMKDKPTNMHNLLLVYCQLHKNPIWQSSEIVRDKKAHEYSDDFFDDFYNKLKQQCKRQAENYSDISKNRRSSFGAYYFKLEQYAVKVAEELSLFEVIPVIPLPLQATKKPPLMLLRVIESLNEKYGLLRSCGLPPDKWLSQDISINQLKQLKKLQKQAEKLINEQQVNKQMAYRNTFINLKNTEGKVLGFTAFFEFLQSSVGQHVFSLAVENTGDELHDAMVSEPIRGDEDFLKLTEKYPEDFNEIIQYAFEQLVVARIPVDGKQGLLNDELFLSKVKQHSDYKRLSKKQLREALEQQLQVIFEKHKSIGHY